MKAIFFAIATIGLAGCTTYPNEDVRKADLSALAGEDEIRPSCKEEWAGDYSAIAFCVKRKTRGFRDVQRLLEEHNIRNGDTTPEAKIFAKCSRVCGLRVFTATGGEGAERGVGRAWGGFRSLLGR